MFLVILDNLLLSILLLSCTAHLIILTCILRNIDIKLLLLLLLFFFVLGWQRTEICAICQTMCQKIFQHSQDDFYCTTYNDTMDES